MAKVERTLHPHSMPPRVTKRLNRFYKAANRVSNLATRCAANQARASASRATREGLVWTGIRNPPAPHRPVF